MADDKPAPKPLYQCPTMRAEYETLARLKDEAAKRDAPKAHLDKRDDTSLALMATLLGDTDVA